jgi:hypothetical protein
VNETSVIDSFVDFDRVNVNGRDVRIVDAVLRQRVLEPDVEDFSSSTSLYAETGFYPLWRSIFRWSGDVSGTASACVNDGLSSFSVP